MQMETNIGIHIAIFVATILSLCSSVAIASDPTQLQDYCIATDNSRGVLVNGKICKDPVDVTSDDFFSPVLRRIGDADNKQGSSVTSVTVEQLPGLNTLGISMAGIDFAPNGLNPPHIHPRATEILTVIEGTLFVGFISSNQPTGRANRLFTKVLRKGDVFVFPEGLIHFQRNIGSTAARAIAALSSQNPGVITIANAVFGSDPLISKDVLMKAFQVDKKIITQLEAQFDQ